MVRLTDWLDMTLTELTGLLISKPTKEGHILFLYPPPKGEILFWSGYHWGQ